MTIERSRVPGRHMDDHELTRCVEDSSLPREQWTHRSHVRVAFYYLSRHSFAEATERLRATIRSYNAAHKVNDGPMSGYNETTTVAFLHLIYSTMQVYGEVIPTQDGDAFCDAHPHLLHKEVLRLFYSPQRRLHPAAKTNFIEPDLAPLPSLLSNPISDSETLPS